MNKANFIFILFLMLFPVMISAQPGTLDNTFDSDGKVSTDFNNGDDAATSMQVLANGKILLSGITWDGFVNRTCLSRYNNDGSIDNSFGVNGKVIIGAINNFDIARDCAVQDDGKIVVAGAVKTSSNNYDFAIFRFNEDGTPDNSFNATGLVSGDVNNNGDDYLYAVKIQEDQKIVVAGFFNNGNNYDILIARYNSNGTPDMSFDLDGRVIMDINNFDNRLFALEIQPDNKILVAGLSGNNLYMNFLLMRLNTNGAMDSTFSNNGFLTTSFDPGNDVAYAIALQPDQKIVVAGYSGTFPSSDFAVARYNSNGTLDTTFNGTGKSKIDMAGFNDNGSDLALESDGKILVTGTRGTSNFFGAALIRLNTNGTLDSTFAVDGKMLTTYATTFLSGGNTIAVLPDHKILVAGYSEETGMSDFALLRYLSDLNIGLVDVSTDKQLLIYPNPVNENTSLHFELNKAENISIALFDLQGKKISELLHQQKMNSGKHETELNLPPALPSGSYIVVLSAEEKNVSIKIIKP